MFLRYSPPNATVIGLGIPASMRLVKSALIVYSAALKKPSETRVGVKCVSMNSDRLAESSV